MSESIMGLFGTKEPVDLSRPGQVQIPTEVAAVVPDPGTYFLERFGDGLTDEILYALTAEVVRRRGVNGWLAMENFADVSKLGRKQTPMSFLVQYVNGEGLIALDVWATYPCKGRALKDLYPVIDSLARTQGHAAAATWALRARPQARLNLEGLASTLLASWEQSLSFLRKKDMIDAFQNWYRQP